MSDYIDRQAAIDAVSSMFAPTPTQKDMVEDCLGIIENLPLVEVEPVKRGKWIYDNQFGWYRASCSECGYKRVTDIKAEKWNGWKYCPNCGAKMEAAPTIIEAEEGEPHEQN